MSNENNTLHKKVNQAREAFHARTQTKSGHNKFAGYTYFELGDFLPDALKAFHEAGLCGMISFGAETATMKIVDVETGATETITSPMSKASLKGCHDVQNLGAVQTYLRRYLWASAIELVEASSVDASAGKEEETLPKDKFIARKFPAIVEKKDAQKPATGGELWSAVTIANVKPYQRDDWKSPMFWIELEDERSAFTWNEPMSNDARIMVGQTVNVRVKRSSRDASKFEYLGFEEIPAEAQDELGYVKE